MINVELKHVQQGKKIDGLQNNIINNQNSDNFSGDISIDASNITNQTITPVEQDLSDFNFDSKMECTIETEVTNINLESDNKQTVLNDFRATGGGVSKRDIEELKEALKQSPATTWQVDTKYDLPNIGNSNYLYIIKQENALYRWDSVDNHYVACARDYEEIDIIDGGNAILVKNIEVKK